MSILPFWILRLWAVAAIWALLTVLPYPAYFSLYVAVLFGHYVMALIASRAQMRSALGNRVLIGWTVFLLTLSVIMATASWPDIVVYFGVHHLLSETYTPLREGDRSRRSLTVARAVLNGLVYVVLLRHFAVFAWIPEPVLWGALVIAYGATVGLLGLAARDMGRRRTLDLLAFESLGFAMALLIPAGVVEARDVIFYHLCFWLIFPVARRWEGWRALPWGYFALTAVLTLAFWIATPVVGWSGLSMDAWSYWAAYFGSLHISVSFLSSKMNPRWVMAAALPGKTAL